MSKSRFIQTNFTAGILSPTLVARPDIAKHANGMTDCRNFIIMPHGGVMRRPGTRFVAEVRDSDRPTRLIPFEFSTTQAYMIEFGHQYFRFFKDRGTITQTLAVAAVNTGSGGAGWFEVAGDHTDEIQTGDLITISGSTGNDGTYTANTVTFPGNTRITVDEVIPDATADGNLTVPYAIGGPYSDTELADIKYTQSADILYLCHPDYVPKNLNRTADTSWSITDFDFMDGPYDPINTTATTLTLSGTTGSVNVTASAIVGINGGTGFQTTDVGRLIRWKDPAGNWTWLEITSRTSTTIVVATIRGADASATTATTDWRLGAWSDTDGWPWVVTFHQGRLWFGGTDAHPQTVWSSQSGDFDGFRPSAPDGTVADDDAITLTLDDDRVNAIRWMLSDAGGLLIGTQGAEGVVKASASGGVLTPTDASYFRQSSYGSHSQANPIQAGAATLFVQRFGFQVREMAFDIQTLDRYVSPDMNLLSDQVARVGPGPDGTQDAGIVQTAYQQNPFSIAWFITDSGRLLSMTYERSQQVVAWAEHPIGGTLVDVESVAVIPDDPYDLTWLIVKRSINGANKRYVEFIEDKFDHGEDQEDAFYVDSGLTYDGAAASTITGLGHLEGEVVSVASDGAVHPNKTVSGEQITLDASGSVVHAGLPYSSSLTSMPLFVQNPMSIGGRINVNQIVFWVWRSGSFDVALNEGDSSFEVVPVRESQDNMDEAVPLDSEVRSVQIHGNTIFDQRIRVQKIDPLPLTILSMSAEVDVDQP